ncbi:hypothetical protein [Hymenobacter cellulosilyticus]|uniref:Lipocalin-like domain-containing protein n=1 Tax=Hymenobacter cellulosilyticus TaxID=2932248 RepID=A0A8T9Q6T8_9BACT|nr:hypothetical protein [Hymenobacter cellulosilyticus]UOQ73274.1 hypothetical protein MUN79_04705 [Hymenobacter cellulosilyticus]
MKNRTHNFFSALLFAGLLVAGSSVQAQNNRIGGAVQNGNGAYVLKTDRQECMTNTLLGLPTLPATSCVTMTQEKFIVTPSGNSSAVWRGMVPEGQRPAQRVVFNSTYVEVFEGPTKGLTYNTVATTEPSGAVTLTFDRKPNGKGKK